MSRADAQKMGQTTIVLVSVADDASSGIQYTLKLIDDGLENNISENNLVYELPKYNTSDVLLSLTY